MRLALAVDQSEEPEQMQVLGAVLRDNGGIEALLGILRNPELGDEVHQSALLVLGNLGSDAVDKHADLTRARLKSFDGFARLLEHVQSSSDTTLIYALGAVQNICSIDPDFARECRGKHPILDWLTSLSQSENDRITHYAVGCIQNIERTNEREDIKEEEAAQAAKLAAEVAGAVPIESR